MPELKRTINAISSNADENTLDVPSEPPRKVKVAMAPKKVISQVNAAFLSNRYSGLPIEDPPAPLTPKVKIPPIVIKHIKFANLLTLLSTLKITEFQTKFMSEGIKVMLSELDTYDKLINHLETKSIQFYTFSVKNKLPVKIVLSQLPKLDVKEIKTEINNQVQPMQLNCEEVRLINTKVSVMMNTLCTLSASHVINSISTPFDRYRGFFRLRFAGTRTKREVVPPNAVIATVSATVITTAILHKNVDYAAVLMMKLFANT